MITGLALGRHVTHLGRTAQSLNCHQHMRQVIEPPGRRGIVRVRYRHRQALGNIMPDWQVLIPRIGAISINLSGFLPVISGLGLNHFSNHS